ncbi:MAG: alpha/beta fold hydrolase [Chloroflexi bacterium]|nr:alpha/beta fold hydrolase [Chloroflexota bacterium]
MLKRMLLTMIAAITLVGGATAQDSAGSILLVPFTDNSYGITGVVPSSWTQYSAGLWLREEPPQTLLAQQGIVGDFNEIVGALLDQLGISELPQPDGTVSANGLDWAVYSIEGPAGTNILVDFALTTQGASVYIVILQADASERDALREAVFIPAVNALTPIEVVAVVPDDAGYTAENVTFNSGVIPLSGTLTLPTQEGPHPAIILISGSGAQDRDETLAGIQFAPFALIADHLTRAGIAVLRYDDRGYGRSGGDYASATIEDFADDAEAALTYLLTRPEIDATRIGVLGHSEGGVVAANMVEAGAPVAFYVLMAGPAVNGADLLAEQNRRLYAAEGQTEEAAESQIAFITEMFPLILNGDSLGVSLLLDSRIREQLASLTEEQLAQIGDVEAFIEQTVRGQLTDFSRPWWPYFLRYDPAEAWVTVSVPVLAVFGELDTQVDADQNATALQTALEASPASSSFEIVTLDGANHLFQLAATGGVSEYAVLQPRFIDAFLPTITEWILEQTAQP